LWKNRIPRIKSSLRRSRSHEAQDLIASLLVILLLAAAGIAYARLAGYSLPWWTADSGGGTSSGGNYNLSGTIGQPDAGTLLGGNYQLEGGFWSKEISKKVNYVYLPLAKKAP
jgi:hypothetical protein